MLQNLWAQQNPKHISTTKCFPPSCLSQCIFGGKESGSLYCPSVYIHQHGFEESLYIQTSFVEHLFGGLFKTPESCTRLTAISLWEIKGIHCSWEGRNMVLSGHLWFSCLHFHPLQWLRLFLGISTSSAVFASFCHIFPISVVYKEQLELSQMFWCFGPWPGHWSTFSSSNPWVTCLNSSSGDYVLFFCRPKQNASSKWLCCFASPCKAGMGELGPI